MNHISPIKATVMAARAAAGLMLWITVYAVVKTVSDVISKNSTKIVLMVRVLLLKFLSLNYLKGLFLI